WSSVAPMQYERFGLAAATGADGRIYAIGGFSDFTKSTVEAYNPASNSWSTLAPMPTARVFLAAVAGADGRIYAIGGFNYFGLNNGVDAVALNTVEAYNPASNSWSTLAPMPTARGYLAAVAGADGRIYA